MCKLLHAREVTEKYGSRADMEKTNSMNFAEFNFFFDFPPNL